MDYGKSKIHIFFSYIMKYKRDFAIDMALSVLISAVDLAFPYATRWSLNNLLPRGAYKAFFAVMAALLASYIVRAVFQYLVVIVGHRMGTRVEADMRRDVFTHMQGLSFSFFDKNRTGVLLSHVTNDLFEIVELAHHGPEHLVTCTLSIVGSLVILSMINIRLTLLLALLLPACMVFSARQRIKMQKANIAVKQKTAQINAAIESGISGIRVSKAFANEREEERKFDEANEAFKKTKVSYYRAMGLFNGSVEATIGICQVFTIAFGGYLMMTGSLTLVDLITFTLYISVFVSPVRKLAQFMELYTQGAAGFSRFVSLMRTEPEITDSPSAVELDEVRGDISFRDVSFSYERGVPVLQGINLDIRHGERIALVGSSGEGKTTLCNLLLRFYDVTEGSVTLDGVDIRQIQQRSLREHIGIIQQDVFLFSGSIRENIRYGRPDATDVEVVEAAIRAGIHAEISKMPQGYDTVVGERGVMLSGGQKQRVSIARVFLKNPGILILDEATSSLDSITEKEISESLDVLSRGKTCLMIAHRLSTIKNADRVVVLEGGRIAESGTRAALLALNGRYASLERAQEIQTDGARC